MADRAGLLRFGPEHGTIALLTTRDGLAAQAGHDLAIEVTQWSAELELGDDQAPAGLTVRADLNSLTVRRGTGGVKPLTDRDRREIAVTARGLLRVDRHPAATFTASRFEPDTGAPGEGASAGGSIYGTLRLAGAERSLRLDVTASGESAYHARGSVRQTDFGIKPYTAFLGVLKVSDVVGIAVDVELPDVAQAGDNGPGSGAGGGERP